MTSSVPIGVLHTALRACLHSVEQFAAAYADWSALAPGLVHGPPFPSSSSSSSSNPTAGEDEPEQETAVRLPIIGDVWTDHQELHARRNPTEGIKGLRMIRLGIRREMEYLEKVRLAFFSWLPICFVMPSRRADTHFL